MEGVGSREWGVGSGIIGEWGVGRKGVWECVSAKACEGSGVVRRRKRKVVVWIGGGEGGREGRAVRAWEGGGTDAVWLGKVRMCGGRGISDEGT